MKKLISGIFKILVDLTMVFGFFCLLYYLFVK